MFVSTFKQDQFKPPNNVLAQCECVRVGRIAPPKVIRDWARENCTSFVWWEIEPNPQGVDKVEVWFYYFHDPADATAFRLKWL